MDALSALAIPALLLFEVMDKEPPLLHIVMRYGLLSVSGILLSRKRWWWGLLLLPVVVLFAWADATELYDPYVGPAIVREAGYRYFLAWHGAIVIGFAGPVCAAILKRRSIARTV